MLKPPTGVKVAIIEFDDLECPFCARAVPLVHATAAQYKIPVEHHDFALTEIHTWSFSAAVTARYLEDRVSHAAAAEFRRDVFAHQNVISSRDDLDRYTRAWFASHHVAQPFDLDAGGACSKQVLADRALGDRLGIHSTPCIFVVTEKSWTEVKDLDRLNQTVGTAVAETRAQPAPGYRPR